MELESSDPFFSSGACGRMAENLLYQPDVHSDLENPLRTGTTMLIRRRAPLFSLTGLRFFAASYVILFHTRLGRSLAGYGYSHAGRFMMSGWILATLLKLSLADIYIFSDCPSYSGHGAGMQSSAFRFHFSASTEWNGRRD